MTAPDLAELFEALVTPIPAISGSDLVAVPIPGASTHRLSKDVNALPCLLIRQSQQAIRSMPIRLENLSVSFDVPCTVRAPTGEVERDTFTIIRCTSADPALFPHFLKIISPVITALGSSPTQAAVRRAISGLVELFQALSAPSKKTIQGLWAELLLIRSANDPVATVSAWHADPLEHFDFAAGPQRLEVKSSHTRRREHYFSLDQLKPAGASRIVVASVFVERLGSGVSLRRLCQEIRALLGANAALVSKFDAVLYASLGSGWVDAIEEAFDWELGTESLAFYPADAVPKPENTRPGTVFDVRFRSDLTALESITCDDLKKLGGMFAAATPGNR